MSERTEQPGKRHSLFWRLWFRSLVVRRPQAALAVIALFVGAALASMLLNLYSDVHRKMTQEFRSYGANIIISSRGVTSPGRGSIGGRQAAGSDGRADSVSRNGNFASSQGAAYTRFRKRRRRRVRLHGIKGACAGLASLSRPR